MLSGWTKRAHPWRLNIFSALLSFKQGVEVVSCRHNAKGALTSPAHYSHRCLQLKVHRDKKCWLLRPPLSVCKVRENLMQTPDFGSRYHWGIQSQGRPAPGPQPYCAHLSSIPGLLNPGNIIPCREQQPEIRSRHPRGTVHAS